MLSFAMFVLLWAPPQSADTDAVHPKDLATKITRQLQQRRASGELAGSELEISVRRQVVTVNGKVTTTEQARAIMNTICDVGDVEGIQLNLGINRNNRADHQQMPPSSWPSYAYPNYAQTSYPMLPTTPLPRHVKLNWDDGWWQLDFDGGQQVSKRRLGESAAPSEPDSER